MTSVLQSVTSSDIRLTPFPHIVINNALPPDLYAQIAAAYPTLEQIMPPRSGDQPYLSNNRYTLSAWITALLDDLVPAWKAFIARHSSPAFFEEVVNLFDGHWPQALLDHLGGSLRGHRMGLLQPSSDAPPRLYLDARAEVNTPVYGAPSVSRGPHLDTPNRLFTGLFYFRAEEDDSTGGELHLYRWKNGPIADFDVFQLPEDAVEIVATVPYRANCLVMFPQQIGALHGVGLRAPTPHVRRYVFLTAELAEPWLALPTAGSCTP